MADYSAIEWTDATWNPVAGCSIISPGCTNCYAMKQAHDLVRRFDMPKYRDLTRVVKGSAVWTGTVRLDEDALEQPLRWKRPRRIFVNSMSDLFHEALPDIAIDQVFDVMELAHWHTFQVLTKRAERMRRYLARERRPLQNVWLGVSVEDRLRTSRILELRASPAAVRFLSIEPLLEELGPLDLAGVSWVIVGGESGPKARPFHLSWARDIVDQCRSARIACFVKQLGAVPFGYGGRRLYLADRKGGDWSEWPSKLRVREFPHAA